VWFQMYGSNLNLAEDGSVESVSDGASTLVYSGDTSWTEALVEAAQGADLFITECYRLSGAPVAHLSLEEIDANRSRFTARRIMLTHMSAEVLDKLAEIEARGYLPAHDGLTLDL